jgi:hypothetical protein
MYVTVLKVLSSLSQHLAELLMFSRLKCYGSKEHLECGHATRPTVPLMARALLGAFDVDMLLKSNLRGMYRDCIDQAWTIIFHGGPH